MQSLSRNNIFKTFNIAAAAILFPHQANAIKGAFELDAEYYLKALVGKKDDSGKLVSKSFPVYVSPRSLDPVFTSCVLSIVLKSMETIGGVTQDTIVERVQQDIPYSLKYFKLFAPISNENIADQYYFDMLIYLYYREAGKVIAKSEQRVELRDLVGDNLLKFILQDNRDIPTSLSTNRNYEVDKLERYSKGTAMLSEGFKRILDVYNSSRLIAGYEFSDEDLLDAEYTKQTFAEVLILYISIFLYYILYGIITLMYSYLHLYALYTGPSSELSSDP